MKFFLKKSSEGSLQSLNEEEIQKKLYGAFHKNTASQSTGVTFNGPKSVPFLCPKLEKSESHLGSSLKICTEKFLKTLKSFPWKFSILVVGFIILSIYSFQFLSGAIQNFSKTFKQQATPVANQSAEKIEIKAEIQKVSQVKKIDRSEALSVPIQNDKPAVLSKKTYYAVQICTYQKETDAKTLSNELKRSNFPAFYMRMQGFQNKTPYYVVFLGKNESYAGANDKLKEFRNSDQGQKFPDAFIRSI